MAGTYKQLKEYIENYCKLHVDVLHQDTEPHFFMLGLDEILTKIRSSVNLPAVFLADYDYRLEDNKSDNILKHRSFALVFLDHCEDVNDYDRIADIYSSMEQLADDFLSRMFKDKQNRAHAFLKDIDLNNINAVQFQAVDNNFGVWLPVVATSTHDILINNDKWSDL